MIFEILVLSRWGIFVAIAKKYIVWIKIIHFSFMTNIVIYKPSMESLFIQLPDDVEISISTLKTGFVVQGHISKH